MDYRKTKVENVASFLSLYFDEDHVLESIAYPSGILEDLVVEARRLVEKEPSSKNRILLAFLLLEKKRAVRLLL